jgi:hypothetical protein
VRDLFRELRGLNVHFEVKVSFLEIYNKKLFDLLSAASSEIRLLQKGKSLTINNLREVSVSNE